MLLGSVNGPNLAATSKATRRRWNPSPANVPASSVRSSLGLRMICRKFDNGAPYRMLRYRHNLAHLSFTCQKKKSKRHYWAVWGTKRHLQEPTRRLARTVGSSTGVERWCLHMCRQLLQQCHRSRLHIHALLSPFPMDGPSASSELWMHCPGQTLVGVAFCSTPTEISAADALSIRSCSQSLPRRRIFHIRPRRVP